MAGHFCIECGAPLQPDDLFCGSCGTRVEAGGAGEGPAPAPPAASPPTVPPPVAPPVAPPTPPYAAPPVAPAAAGGSKVPIPLVVGVIGALLAGGVLAWVLVSDGDDSPAAGGGEVFLEAVADPGPDAFTASVAAPLPAAPPPLSIPSIPPATVDTTATTATTVTPPGPAVAGVAATRPGLYGGTRDAASCDVEQMITFLAANPDKAAAFAQVQGITSADLPGYLRGLTPLLLRADTRVTNHGFRDGRATPRQSVLQAGTAVLVDQFGIPRVKCGCGNPLLPPVATSVAPTYTGPPWPAWSPTTVVTITNVTNVVIQKFIVIDVVAGDYFERTPGSTFTDTPILADELCDLYPELCGGTTPPVTEPRPEEPELLTGDVQVTLRWSGTADLDLAVTDPTGEQVSYGNPLVSSGGTLDVDANAACGDTMAAPVENIVWPTSAPSGTYQIEVNLWSSCDDAAGVGYQLTVLVGGQPVSLSIGRDDGVLEPTDGVGTVSDDAPTVVYVFERG